jgi:hypothetical protein
MTLFIATCTYVRLPFVRSRQPGQRAARRRPFSVAFLSALPAAGFHRLAASLWRFLRRTRPGDGGDVGGRRADADPDGVSRRPLRSTAVSGRRHAVDDPVDDGDGVCHRLLAGGPAGTAFWCRQFGHPPGGLRDPQRLGRPGAARPVIRLPHLRRQYRVCRCTAGDGRPDAALRLARRVDLCRPLGPPSGRDHPVAEPHTGRSGTPPAAAGGNAPFRHRTVVQPVGADVLRLLHGVLDGRRRHPIMADTVLHQVPGCRSAPPPRH